MALQSELNDRVLEMIRELAGGAFFTVPSSVADFDNALALPEVETVSRLSDSDHLV